MTVTQAPPSPSGSRAWAVLRNPVFLIIWVSQALTQTAQNVINFALLILAQNLTGTATGVGLIILSFSAPAVLFGALAGVLVDRWNKKLVMAVSTVLRGAAVASYLLVRSPQHMWWAYAASFVFSAAAQFFSPAEGTVIPKVVGKQHLIAANSIYNLTFMGSQFVGFTLLGWLLVKIFGLYTVFGVMGAVFLVCSVLLALARIPTMETEPQEGNALAKVWDELLEGWHFIAQRRTLSVSITHLSVINSSYLLIGTLGPAFAAEILRIGPANLGILLAPAGICTLIGAVVVNHLARPSNRYRMIHAGLLGVGLAIVALALVEPVTSSLVRTAGGSASLGLITLLAVLFTTPFGFSAALVAIPAQTVLQENSPDEIRGRVLATFFTLSNGVAFFPIIAVGVIADRVGVLPTMAGIGLLIAGLGAASHFVYHRSGRAWDRVPAHHA